MTIAGILLVIILIYKLFINNSKEYKFFLFKISIVISMFINLGYFFDLKIHLSYSKFIMYYYVLYSGVLLLLQKTCLNKIKIKAIISSFVLSFIIICGLINLIYNRNLPMIAPWGTVIDEIAFGRAHLVYPKFSEINIAAFRDMVIFLIYCFMSIEYFYNKKYVNALIKNIKKYFNILFIIIIIEFVIDNVVKVNLARDFINYVFGIVDSTYTIAPMRFGVYAAYGLFVEPSNVGAIMIVYYSIIYCIGFSDKIDIIYFALSFIIDIVSMSSTAFLVIPFGIFVGIKHYIKGNKSNENEKYNRYYRKKIFFKIGIMLILLPIIMFILGSILNSNNKKINTIVEQTKFKISAYVNNDRRDGSAFSRGYGNNLAYEIVRSNPIFGVGLNTTRAFGLIPGVLECIGILGVIAYIIFIKYHLNLKVDKSNIVLLIIILSYLTSTFSIWHIYNPVIIVIFICFNFHSRGLNSPALVRISF